MPRLATKGDNLLLPYYNELFIKLILNKASKSKPHTLKKDKRRKKR